MGFWKEAKEMFARFGNPSGGMVHNDMPAQDAPKAEAPKKEAEPSKLSSYMKKVGVLAAAFGNPSGGFVHNDMTKETSKVADELLGKKKAEPNKAVVAAALAARRSR